MVVVVIVVLVVFVVVLLVLVEFLVVVMVTVLVVICNLEPNGNLLCNIITKVDIVFFIVEVVGGGGNYINAGSIGHSAMGLGLGFFYQYVLV